jgi:hypothetical protein
LEAQKDDTHRRKSWKNIKLNGWRNKFAISKGLIAETIALLASTRDTQSHIVP